MEIVFSRQAKKDWQKLDASIRNQLLKKLAFFVFSKEPLHYAEKLRDENLGQYRFRIGDYRIIFDIENHAIFVLKVGHRREIYKS